ncbi:MAG: hypothetical protein JKY98_01395 [Gammaproteobacteria bacterium]|nr:hypothetical protein [Gammaproteobacteria bacterium]
MKKSLFILFAVIATFMSQTATADNWRNRSYDRHNDHSYRSRNHYRGSHYSRNYYSRNNHRGNRYSYNHGRRNSYFDISIGRSYHYDHFNGGSFLGGLVLGSVLTYPRYSRYDNYQYRSTGTYRSPQVTVINRTDTVASGRRLLRDLEGRCYEIITDENGNELRTELEPVACNF